MASTEPVRCLDVSHVADAGDEDEPSSVDLRVHLSATVRGRAHLDRRTQAKNSSAAAWSPS